MLVGGGGGRETRKEPQREKTVGKCNVVVLVGGGGGRNTRKETRREKTVGKCNRRPNRATPIGSRTESNISNIYRADFFPICVIYDI